MAKAKASASSPRMSSMSSLGGMNQPKARPKAARPNTNFTSQLQGMASRMPPSGLTGPEVSATPAASQAIPRFGGGMANAMQAVPRFGQSQVPDFSALQGLMQQQRIGPPPGMMQPQVNSGFEMRMPRGLGISPEMPGNSPMMRPPTFGRRPVMQR